MPDIPFDHIDPASLERPKGRGARSNTSGRYETETRDRFDDGWESLGDLEPLRTSVQFEDAKRIISRNASPDISFDRSINPYRGCEHGCIYCYARPSHTYLGHSAGLDFETKLYAKPNAADLLRTELSERNYEPESIALGANTDPYQPIERRHRITRQILKVLDETSHPVTIVTKSTGILRDLDILERMAERALVKVAISVTTLDRDIARRMEPRASTPQKRIDALSQLTAVGVPCSVLVAPIIPALNDWEIERILETAAKAGARHAGYVLLRLPLEIRTLFREWLTTEFPDRARRVIRLMKEMRGGRDYESEWGLRKVGRGPYAEQIAARFRLALKRNGLDNGRTTLRTDLFEPPVRIGDQMRLF